ncbi:MAG: 5'/3'-nucleotidase SurE [Ignavibacteria bacterium RIFOXYB2_FULL_35_12]|nr:MAG: 5'/3'-nucleotidase SurE [Ignavibacteria bacterium GWA2_36_19]OGU51824.1 MAG: 5'/3'-nucleotidase SurE [Ignavibacteria bacterium GWC2_35_8]OGU56208.1 MAG: 5'/3'-nucleotidase SurE [Ignavibacteria bacterium GWF2_35_20]OGU83404.1 MAG: 5'/3'-nucleotidase SurE [Ignavibacteria bacterium RIFOXYA2_FULL_35_9]OGU86720.1 MAG: 5'/3'-nucleotidase SurE [Ignavibacteria bacterium RIFOXYC12_FULL_35_11]OGU89415.1 MAG: 5'/3'-nucleotidase SurE [Ignavibacteria bacterium RIFOXYA12_FULL_35_25]OGU94107.1 MAG: 
MKILVSNDDGIDSPGISALVKSLKEIADVTVVAPQNEQSAVGHAITMKIPLRVTPYYKNGDFFGYAVDGTPADCVKMGIRNIMKEPPDLVFSGINNGSNTAINIIYSGTVSAAREAAIMEVPAAAISVTNHATKNFNYAAKLAKMLALKMKNNKLTLGTMLNVNVPDVAEEELAGIILTKQGKSKWDDIYEQRQDPYGRDYYWLTGKMFEVDTNTDIDQVAIQKKYVSITPIHFDLTDYDTFDKMKSWHIENLMNEKEA